MPSNYQVLQVSPERMEVLTKAERFVVVEIYVSGGQINEWLVEIYETS